MKRIAAAIVLMAVSGGLWVSDAFTAAPKPAPVSATWQLDIDVQTPQAIRVQVPGEQARVFWVMKYIVSNRTGTDQIFVPEFVLYTETGQVLRAGQGVPAGVFGEIKKTLNEPLLRDSVGVAGKLLQGDDNAKVGVAIWPEFDAKAGAFDVFVGGLSGETAEAVLPDPVEVAVRNPDGTTKMVAKDKMILSKTLHLSYTVPGEASQRPHAEVKQVGMSEWVMR